MHPTIPSTIRISGTSSGLIMLLLIQIIQSKTPKSTCGFSISRHFGRGRAAAAGSFRLVPSLGLLLLNR